MKKSILLILLSSILCLAGCGEDKPQPKPDPTPEDTSLIGKKFSYNGRFDKMTYEDGLLEEDFNEDLQHFFSGQTHFRQRMAENLSSYITIVNTIKNYVRREDKKISFEDTSTAKTMKYNGKDVTTYLVNKNDTDCLCQYGLATDIDGNDIYHLYAPETLKEGETNVTLFPVIEEFVLTSAGIADITVTDEGFKYENKQVKFNFKIVIHSGEFTDVARFAMYFGDGTSDDVEIISQPKDLHVNYPDAIDFSVEVNHPEDVVSYRWYSGAYDEHGGPIGMGPIDGTLGASKDLHIPTIGCMQSVAPFQCLITTKDREFFSDCAKLYIDNSDDYVPVAYLLDYPIKAGETLDLSKTPYGTGKIIYDKNETDFIFDNVHFDNTNIESDLQSLGFMIQSYANPHAEYNFEFKGTTIWNNTYWEENNHQGGFGFFIHFAGTSVIPTINFKGNKVTFIGGTRAISAYADLNIYNDIEFVGVQGRLSCGIFAYSITVKSGVNITGMLGGSILSTLNSNNNQTGTITIEEGASVVATIRPGRVSWGATSLNAMYAIFDITIENATVDINILIDYMYFVSESETYLAPVIGMSSNAGFIIINDSIVNIDIKSYRSVPSPDLLAQGVQAISAMVVKVSDSRINININSDAFIDSCGIYCVTFETENSLITLFNHSQAQASGIVGCLTLQRSEVLNDDMELGIRSGQEFEFLDQDSILSHELSGSYYSKVTIKSSTLILDISANSYNGIKGQLGYIDAGIRACTFDMSFTGNNYLDIKAGYTVSPIVASFDKVDDKPEPSDLYIPTYLSLDGFTVLSNGYKISADSYESYDDKQKKIVYVACESMYLDNSYSSYCSWVRVSGQSN